MAAAGFVNAVSVSSLLDRCLDLLAEHKLLGKISVSVSSLLDRCLDLLVSRIAESSVYRFSILAVGSLPRPPYALLSVAALMSFSILAVGSLPRPSDGYRESDSVQSFSILAVGSLPRP